MSSLMCDRAVVSTDSRFTMPTKLPALVERYADKTPPSVRFRLPSWEKALDGVPGRPTKLLSDPAFTSASTTKDHRELGDRVVKRDAVVEACTSAGLTSTDAIVAAYVLVMAWGSGTSNSRSLRNTRKSLQDVSAAGAMLRDSAAALRHAEEVLDPAVLAVHRQFSLPGVGEAFFTKWFTFAGYVPGRAWQPLILDRRVRATLHKTLDVWLNQLTAVRNGPNRYVAYLSAMHSWSAQLPQPMTAAQLEWIMFTHNGAAA